MEKLFVFLCCIFAANCASVIVDSLTPLSTENLFSGVAHFQTVTGKNLLNVTYFDVNGNTYKLAFPNDTFVVHDMSAVVGRFRKDGYWGSITEDGIGNCTGSVSDAYQCSEPLTTAGGCNSDMMYTGWACPACNAIRAIDVDGNHTYDTCIGVSTTIERLASRYLIKSFDAALPMSDAFLNVTYTLEGVTKKKTLKFSDCDTESSLLMSCHHDDFTNGLRSQRVVLTNNSDHTLILPASKLNTECETYAVSIPGGFPVGRTKFHVNYGDPTLCNLISASYMLECQADGSVNVSHSPLCGIDAFEPLENDCWKFRPYETDVSLFGFFTNSTCAKSMDMLFGLKLVLKKDTPIVSIPHVAYNCETKLASITLVNTGNDGPIDLRFEFFGGQASQVYSLHLNRLSTSQANYVLSDLSRICIVGSTICVNIDECADFGDIEGNSTVSTMGVETVDKEADDDASKDLLHLILWPVLGGVLFIALVGFVVFLIMRKKSTSHVRML